MVGNDVVDLRRATHRPRSPRFDARVFSDAEQSALSRASDQARLRWRLWAAKEAAYKLLRREDARVIFSPRRFAVESPELLAQGADVGALRHADQRVMLRYVDGDDYVHAVAVRSEEQMSEVVHGLARLGGLGVGLDASAAVRRLACDTLAPLRGLEPDAVRVKRRERIPDLYVEGEDAPWGALSLSHHGDHVAYAWLGERAPAARGAALAKAS